MGKTMVIYEICDDSEVRPGMLRFEPCGSMNRSLKEALIELKEKRKRYPGAYIAKVTYERATVQTTKRMGKGGSARKGFQQTAQPRGRQ